MAHLDSKEVDITKQDIVDALRQPANFAYSGHNEDMFHTWSLGPIILNHDSCLVDESNYDMLEKHLESDESLSEEWAITRCSFWGDGWVDHISFRAIEDFKNDDDPKVPTRIFRVLTEWFDTLKESFILNEIDYSNKIFEATIENIGNVGLCMTKDEIPDDWISKCYSWFESNCPNEIEDTDGFGGYPSDDKMKECLGELGFLEEEGY